ncbi:MAG: hypothetical protein K9K38_00110 [Rhodoferax sp.]|nr:hypothetical protein [Rhodoferax sp.]
MVAITATNSATVSLQLTLNKARLQQAQREADRAENTAQQLREQADQAEQEAVQSRDTVRKVAANNRLQNPIYTSPASSNSAETPVKVQNFIENLYRSTRQQREQSGNTLKDDETASPIVNPQGQSTGRVLNIRV